MLNEETIMDRKIIGFIKFNDKKYIDSLQRGNVYANDIKYYNDHGVDGIKDACEGKMRNGVPFDEILEKNFFLGKDFKHKAYISSFVTIYDDDFELDTGQIKEDVAKEIQLGLKEERPFAVFPVNPFIDALKYTFYYDYLNNYYEYVQQNDNKYSKWQIKQNLLEFKNFNANKIHYSDGRNGIEELNTSNQLKEALLDKPINFKGQREYRVIVTVSMEKSLNKFADAIYIKLIPSLYRYKSSVESENQSNEVWNKKNYGDLFKLNKSDFDD